MLLVRIGDLETETTLLDPLAKSLLHYLRLLLPDDAVKILELRSLAELEPAVRDDRRHRVSCSPYRVPVARLAAAQAALASKK